MKTYLPVLVVMVTIVSVTGIIIQTEEKAIQMLQQLVNSFGCKSSIDEMLSCDKALVKELPQLANHWSSHLGYCCAFRRNRDCIVHKCGHKDPMFYKLLTVGLKVGQQLFDIDCHLFWHNTGAMLCNQPVWAVMIEVISLVGLFMAVLLMVTIVIISYYRNRRPVGTTV